MNSQADLCLVSFPFYDLTRSKVRPCVIISNDTYNVNSSDVLILAITSRKPNNHFLAIDNTNLINGNLKLQSYIRYDTIAKIEKKLLIKRIANLNSNTIQKAINLFNQIIELRPQS